MKNSATNSMMMRKQIMLRHMLGGLYIDIMHGMAQNSVV